MRFAWPILVFLFACSTALADKRATSFVDDVNRRIGEPYFFFNAGEYERGLFFNVHSWFSTRKAKWLYHVSVRGVGSEFPAERITVKNELAIPVPTEVPLAGGSLKLDRKKRTITLSLKVRVGDAIEDFHGNGTFHLERSQFEKKG
jgi:hypothetical protein